MDTTESIQSPSTLPQASPLPFLNPPIPLPPPEAFRFIEALETLPATTAAKPEPAY